MNASAALVSLHARCLLAAALLLFATGCGKSRQIESEITSVQEATTGLRNQIREAQEAIRTLETEERNLRAATPSSALSTSNKTTLDTMERDASALKAEVARLKDDIAGYQKRFP